MGFLIALYCVTFAQISLGQIFHNNGQNAMNAGQPFTNTNPRELVTNAQLASRVANLNGMPANQFASNVAYNGKNLANAQDTNLANANANLARFNQANVNSNGQNLANSNFPLASNVVNAESVNANIATQHLANNIFGANLGNVGSANNGNLGYAEPNLSKLGSSNLINANLPRPDLIKQLYPSRTSLTSQISGNVASPYTAQNGFNPNNNNNRNPNVGNGNFGLVNMNMAGRLPGNLASGLARPNYGNFPNALAPGNLLNGLEGYSFGIDGNPFTVINGLPGGQCFGMQIVADALEIGGTVAVSGKMPLYGTVTLNGNLPADGMAKVNYGCTSQRKL